MQPPNGTAAHINTQEERKVKVQEYLRTITFCFTKLRRICEKCNYSSSTMEYTHIEVDVSVQPKHTYVLQIPGVFLQLCGVESFDA